MKIDGTQTMKEFPLDEPEQSENPRYECLWRDESGRRVHYWVDNMPTEPHWPPSAAMRWGLRPDDWHEFWPELIDHPCALLFAPTHPHRSGPPRFRDWVQSWPAGFDWESDLPEHLHVAVRKAQAEIMAPPAEPSAPSPMEPAKQDTKPLKPFESVDQDNTIERLALLLMALDESKRAEAEKLLTTLVIAPDSTKVVQSLSRLLNVSIRD